VRIGIAMMQEFTAAHVVEMPYSIHPENLTPVAAGPVFFNP
jgi:hypothetical protein